jgi:hypothetical protein
MILNLMIKFINDPSNIVKILNMMFVYAIEKKQILMMII